MTILNITNLTSDPIRMLRENINNAIKWVESEENIKLSEEQKEECHNSIKSMVEAFEEEGKVSEALSFVDNLLINHDYVATVQEVVNN